MIVLRAVAMLADSATEDYVRKWITGGPYLKSALGGFFMPEATSKPLTVSRCC